VAVEAARVFWVELNIGVYKVAGKFLIVHEKLGLEYNGRHFHESNAI
jgi:hypothetical protein